MCDNNRYLCPLPSKDAGKTLPLSSNRSLPRCCCLNNNNNNRSLKIEIPRWKLQSKNACFIGGRKGERIEDCFEFDRVVITIPADSYRIVGFFPKQFI
ncbi:hypothetical protein CDAR_249141 [Caerostris darwini]|uniref:Uncharacterized protein n=1 Tax=Caerostris darwini TaxID=1538125 RepID=A0AAV4SBL3_9ARAC|nr:hypothetical protein CDAR_249141 [Caerostris darwini]